MKCSFYFRLAVKRGNHWDLLREYVGVAGDILSTIENPANLAQCDSFEAGVKYIAEHQALYPDKKIQMMRFQPDQIMDR
jgi:hypothetical protein